MEVNITSTVLKPLPTWDIPLEELGIRRAFITHKLPKKGHIRLTSKDEPLQTKVQYYHVDRFLQYIFPESDPQSCLRLNIFKANVDYLLIPNSKNMRLLTDSGLIKLAFSINPFKNFMQSEIKDESKVRKEMLPKYQIAKRQAAILDKLQYALLHRQNVPANPTEVTTANMSYADNVPITMTIKKLDTIHMMFEVCNGFDNRFLALLTPFEKEGHFNIVQCEPSRSHSSGPTTFRMALSEQYDTEEKIWKLIARLFHHNRRALECLRRIFFFTEVWSNLFPVVDQVKTQNVKVRLQGYPRSAQERSHVVLSRYLDHHHLDPVNFDKVFMYYQHVKETNEAPFIDYYIGWGTKDTFERMRPFVHPELFESPKDHKPLCRAYWKMWEVLDKYVPEGERITNAMDIGASPGGWSQVLLYGPKVDHVISVDPGKLDPSLLDNSKLTHIPTRVEAFLTSDHPLNPTKGGKKLDFVCCDMNKQYNVTVPIIRELDDAMAPGALCVLTLKLRKKCSAKVIEKTMKEAIEGLADAYENFQCVHLFANTRDERTLIAYRKK